jgi:hypothetical protein
MLLNAVSLLVGASVLAAAGVSFANNPPFKSHSHLTDLSQLPEQSEVKRDLPFTGPISGPLAYSPPKYPSPWGSGSGEWADAYTKARAIVSQMTLLEKVNLTTGVG